LGFSQVIVRGQAAKRCVEGCWGMKRGIGGGGEIGWGWRDVGAVVGCHSDDERDMLESDSVYRAGVHTCIDMLMRIGVVDVVRSAICALSGYLYGVEPTGIHSYTFMSR